MRQETFATFNSTIPDDYHDKDGVEIPGGQNILTAICDELRKSGFKPTTPVQHSFYGWAFEFPIRGIRVWVLIQGGGEDPWLLTVHGKGGWLTPWNNQRLLAAGIVALKNVITESPFFRDAQWMTEKDYLLARRNIGEAKRAAEAAPKKKRT